VRKARPANSNSDALVEASPQPASKGESVTEIEKSLCYEFAAEWISGGENSNPVQELPLVLTDMREEVIE